MKHKKFSIAIIMVVVVVAVVGAWLIMSQNQATRAKPHTITGRVTRIVNECQSDGTCSVTLDGTKTIITGCGLMANGKSCAAYDQTKLRLGQEVEATVVEDDPGQYSLECDTCTIRVNTN
jgi:flagellar basal body-associated protein FliL